MALSYPHNWPSYPQCGKKKEPPCQAALMRFALWEARIMPRPLRRS